MDFALGELGLLPHVFWAMTWPEYERTVSGYHLRQTREWERTRQLGLWLFAANGVKSKTGKPLTAKDLLPLPTDEKQKRQRTPKETEEAKAFLAQIQAKALAKKQHESN